MAAQRRKTASLIPVCVPLENRLVLSGNSLSHAFDRLAHNLNHIGQQITHVGQHHNTNHGPRAQNGGLAARYHHIVK